MESQPYIVQPEVCKYYSRYEGCTRGDKCLYMHICRHYIIGDCAFGAICKYSHDFFKAQPKAVLVRCGVNINRTRSEILQDLSSVSVKHFLLQGGRDTEPVTTIVSHKSRSGLIVNSSILIYILML